MNEWIDGWIVAGMDLWMNRLKGETDGLLLG